MDTFKHERTERQCVGQQVSQRIFLAGPLAS